MEISREVVRTSMWVNGMVRSCLAGGMSSSAYRNSVLIDPRGKVAYRL